MNEIRKKIRLIRDNFPDLGGETVTLMEVCGTHTMSIAANGIRSLLPSGINLISGPGCPVCVTSQGDIDSALQAARREEVLIATFGDMVRVPSRGDRLENYRNVQIVYSPMEALDMAEENINREVVFIGVGFETTAPLVAATILEAEKRKLKNFSVLSLHKTVPAALELILKDENCAVDGLILPGHVSAVTGASYFNFLRDLNISGVVTGFEALDIMESIYLLVRMIRGKQPDILNNYRRAVTEEGNGDAMKKLHEVFLPSNAWWRGIGNIEGSGLKIREEFLLFDAVKKLNLTREEIPEPPGCLCGSILLGRSVPRQCRHFGKDCTPSNPVGPCMVSSEGTCAAWYKYGIGE